MYIQQQVPTSIGPYHMHRDIRSTLEHVHNLPHSQQHVLHKLASHAVAIATLISLVLRRLHQ